MGALKAVSLFFFFKEPFFLDFNKHSTELDGVLFCVLLCGLFTLENSFNMVLWRGNVIINTNQ